MAALPGGQNSSKLYSSPNDLTRFIIKHDPDELVGRGGFSSVYKCTWKREDGSVDYVAIKAVLPNIDKDALRREIGIWKRLRHDCIVSLLGTTTHYSPMSIVSSWMPNGTLMSYLKNDHVQKSPTKKYDLLYNVADGLKYLHSQSVVHGDLTSNNVLINENGQACLTDFGLSSMMKPGEKFQYLRPDGKQAGDLRWSAPELINYVDGEMYVPSPSSDIYSYGWIMYEILSGRMPSLDLRAILNGETPERPDAEHMPDEDWIFVLQCWLSLPSLRPSAPQALRFAQTRLSVYKDRAESDGTLNFASTYSAHLEGANICNLSSLVRPHPRPAFSDSTICWKSIDKLAEALVTSKRCQHGLDDAIQLYHVSFAIFTPNFMCMTSSLRKIALAIPPITTEQSPITRMMVTLIMITLDEGDPCQLTSLPYQNQNLLCIAERTTESDLDIFSRVKNCYRQSFRKNTGDILSCLQIALACARISENIDQADFSLEAYETYFQLLPSYILSATRITPWAEPVEYLSTGIAVDAAAAALRVGDVGKAVELLEWGKELLRTHIVQSHISEGDEKQIQEISSSCPRPSFSRLLKATQGRPVVMLIASRRSCDAIIVSYPQALHVPLETMSLDSLAELSTIFQSCISSTSENSESVERTLENVLRRLWFNVVEPVIDHLENVLPDTRIWWCPTSFFSTLPIHAAANYASNGRRSSRHYISSYTSSITSLLQAQRTCTNNPISEFAAIYVAKPLKNDEEKADEYSVIKSPGLEPNLVSDNLPASLCFRRFREATKRDALKAFKDHGWFHVMAYASQNASESLNSSFLMRDGSLSISDIIGANVGPKEFAFLSPRPIGSRSSWMQDEVVQFAAGLQMSGFKSVVGMMDKMGDFKVIDKFYRTLFRTAPLDCTRAAQALHDTLDDMASSDAGLSLRQRVAFAHFGL